MRTVVITGATSGFGKGLVKEFLAQGDRVIATGRNLSKRQEILVDERILSQGRLIEKDLDVTSAAQRLEFANYCRQELGTLDVLVNNAGYGVFGALEDLDESQLRQQFEANFFGLALVTQSLLPILRIRHGRIINLSSVLGFMGLPLTSAYCASKYAVEGLTEALRFELAPHNVQVCLVEPGSFPTGFGIHLNWGQRSQSPSSAFRKQSQNYEKMRQGLSQETPFNNPHQVVRGIVKLSQKKRMPLRKRFGLDCQGSFWLRRLLPERVFLGLMGLLFRMTINQGA